MAEPVVEAQKHGNELLKFGREYIRKRYERWMEAAEKVFSQGQEGRMAGRVMEFKANRWKRRAEKALRENPMDALRRFQEMERQRNRPYVPHGSETAIT